MMLSLGSTKQELLAKGVCSKLSSVLANEEQGEKIAIQSADVILQKVRNEIKNESLAKAIEFELVKCHPTRNWSFKQ